MDLNQLYQQLTAEFPTYTIYKDHPLAPYTTLKIGGPADIFIDISAPDQFISIVNFVYKRLNIIDAFPANGRSDNFQERNHVSEAQRVSTAKIVASPESSEHRKNSLTNQLPITILGNGSNVLISDSGLHGLVIRYYDPLQTIIQKTLSQNLVGLETFAYIPASLGGAIVSNIHGVDKNNFNQFLDTITVFNLQTGQSKTLKATNLKWDYDYSEFQDHPHLIILSATFNLQKGNGQTALKKYHQIIADKTATQPMNSAGCMFKNLPAEALAKAGLPAISTGQIIDKLLGLKGKTIGSAQISPFHANFIVNTGNATSKDYLSLIRFIQSTAKSKLNLDLELEIKLLGEF